MDTQEYRKRVLLGLCTRPMTLLPFIGGTSLLIGSWATAQNAGPLPFVGLVGVLAGAGTFLSSLFTGGGKVAEKVVRDMRMEENQRRERSLDDLEHRLAKDGDPRTEQALRDLRRLARMLRQDDGGASGVSVRTGFDILTDVNQLFQTSVGYLERTLNLGRAALDIEQSSARTTLLDQREHLVREVQSSVDHLGEVLAQLQALAESGSDSSLERLRKELDENLEIARRVDERMAEWEDPYRDLNSPRTES